MSLITLIPTALSVDNPLNGVLPNFGVFGVQFTQLWQKLLGGVWGIGIVVAIVFVIVGVVQMGAATNGGNPAAWKDARTQVLWAGISLGLLAALAVIVGGILALFS